MRYIYGTTQIDQYKNSIVVLGNFDGVHLGHQKLFELAHEKASETGFQVVALSFYPHPTWVVGKHPKPLLMGRLDKKNKLARMGIDVFIEYPFDLEFASISATAFFEDILIRQLKAKIVIVGSNYYFGKNKQGDIHYMSMLGNKNDVEVCVVDTVKHGGIAISSTYIRQLVVEGNLETVKELLGHPYTIVGSVVHGKKLGRTIGFPTVNIVADPNRSYPPNGVYATIVKVYNQHYMGITNIGFNPTVNGKNKMVETYLFDFTQTIYGKEIEVAFYHFIRPEMKFESVDKLVEQMTIDASIAKDYLKNYIDSLQNS